MSLLTITAIIVQVKYVNAFVMKFSIDGLRAYVTVKNSGMFLNIFVVSACLLIKNIEAKVDTIFLGNKRSAGVSTHEIVPISVRMALKLA